MAKFIVIRLHPDKAMQGTQFSSYLLDLEIKAFDASFTDPAGQQPGALLGSTKLPPSKIVQHKVPHPDPVKAAEGEVLLKAVASAGIALPAQPPAEYAGPDILLHVLRGGELIRKVSVDYNVAVADGNGIIFDLTGVEPALVAAYVELPDPGLAADPDDAVVELPEDGTPPSFESLKAAVEKVLQQDPGNLDKLASLSVAECRHIAREIAWNRHVEPSPTVSKAEFENMYTVPPPSPPPSDFDPKMQQITSQQFEGAVAEYRAIHDARADALARYIFALSAAIACERRSADATLAGLSFPILLDVPVTGKVQAASVILQN
jgi:hypothetical protein